MPKPPRRDNDHDHDRDDDHDYERKHEHSDRRGRDFPVFLKVRGRRWLGSAPPTAQAYARAMTLWRQLPGAIGTSAADLAGPENTPPDGPDGKDKS